MNEGKPFRVNLGSLPKQTQMTLKGTLMINDFEDFCTWMYAIIDDLWQQIEPFFKRPGPNPECSDSELLTLHLWANVAVGM
jgi:hypothetical protein